MANEAIASSMDFFSTRSAVALFSSSEEDISLSSSTLSLFSKSLRKVFLVRSSSFLQRWIFSRERSAKKRREFVSLKKNSFCVSLFFFLFFLNAFCFFCFFFALKKLLSLFCSAKSAFFLFFLLFAKSFAPRTRKNLELFSLATHTHNSLFFLRHIF